jgi:mlo protein
MLLGFVSLLLVVFQDLIQKICIDKSLMEHWLPCRGGNDGKHASASAAAHYAAAASTFAAGGRRMLKGGAAFGHCSSKVFNLSERSI